MKHDMKESLHIRRALLLTVKTFKDRKGNLSNKPIPNHTYPTVYITNTYKIE